MGFTIDVVQVCNSLTTGNTRLTLLEDVTFKTLLQSTGLLRDEVLVLGGDIVDASAVPDSDNTSRPLGSGSISK